MTDDLRLIVVSGMSGSGKSVALRVLEDLGYYCIDNLPAALLDSVIVEIRTGGDPVAGQVAVGVDVRNRPKDLDSLPTLIANLKQSGVHTELLFLQASDDVLLKRYRETRRRHPLAEHGGTLHGAIDRERDILAEIVNSADLIIETSHSSVYELAATIRERVDKRPPKSLSVLIESFGYKNGIPADADFVFDLRCLPNPYWTLELRGCTGKDREVVEFLDAQEAVAAMYADILAFLKRWIPEYESAQRSYLTVAIGCTGGQHRSVYMADKLAKSLQDIHDPVRTRHNALKSPAMHEP